MRNKYKNYTVFFIKIDDPTEETIKKLEEILTPSKAAAEHDNFCIIFVKPNLCPLSSFDILESKEYEWLKLAKKYVNGSVEIGRIDGYKNMYNEFSPDAELKYIGF